MVHDDDIWSSVDRQRADLAVFLDTLSPEQWSAQSLCQEWTVRDVAAHLTQSTASWLWLGVQAVRFGFRFDPMVAHLARSDTRPPDAIASALRDMVGVRRRPPGTTVVDPLMDVLVHGQDIALPLGVTRPMPIDASVVVAQRLWGMTFPLNPRKRFGHVELVATDADFRVGFGPRVSGTIANIVLALAGREAGRAKLSGGDRVLLARRNSPGPSHVYDSDG